jgi:hypothetical protein
VTKLELETARLLRASATLLRDTGWTQGAMARDTQGRMADFLGSEATCFCLEGAIARARRDGGLSFVAYDHTFAEVRKTLDGVLPYRWNDVPGRTAEEVIGVLERTAGRLEQAA